ncbi:hypothetical protein EPUS_09164 [Endocarpon pusillum Z07020]|uniref:Uncharacterized protein n=1 Tax=Endocarpon pusillum (strain Z07020 / HMAS-L-300199) TaxID=1263415 RepID=U1GT29_ENDPU|nr:uncharacterized protein EPUS_09164 [Endocarpon pusillum Z07020]ERF75568.1 hypothetical protein EPUS_09164 [Endocarpon pusillum Z07020]
MTEFDAVGALLSGQSPAGSCRLGCMACLHRYDHREYRPRWDWDRDGSEYVIYHDRNRERANARRCVARLVSILLVDRVVGADGPAVSRHDCAVCGETARGPFAGSPSLFNKAKDSESDTVTSSHSHRDVEGIPTEASPLRPLSPRRPPSTSTTEVSSDSEPHWGSDGDSIAETRNLYAVMLRDVGI